MTKALIGYYSVTDTTRRITDRVAVGLEETGIAVRVHDLRDGFPADVAHYDIIGIGSPTHYFRLPTPVSRAIRALGALDGRSSFAFVLQGTYRGDALNLARRALGERGAVEIGAFATRGENRFLGYLREGFQSFPGYPDSGGLQAAEEFGRAVAMGHAARLAGASAPTPAPFDPRAHWMYRVERAVASPALTREVYSRFMRADAALCTKCGRCAKKCPTGAITFTPHEIPRWGNACILCGNCVIECPEDAVRCPLDWPVMRPFMRYNVLRAAADPQIEHVRVMLARGRIERVADE